MFLPWFPFYNILPIFYDQNSDYWTMVRLNCVYISFISFFLYYLTFLVAIIIEYLKLNKNSISTYNIKLIEFIVRSIIHGFFSIVAISIALLSFPEGTIYLFIIHSASIHIFLNWNYSFTYIMYLINNKTSFNINHYFKRQVEVIDVEGVTSLRDSYLVDIISKNFKNKEIIKSVIFFNFKTKTGDQRKVAIFKQ
jgi:uncharacterized membrane protein